MGRAPARDGGAGTATPSATTPSATEPVTVTSGADALKESKSARMKQESLRADDEDAIKIAGRKVKNKTFYQRDKVLVDAEFNGEARLPETTLTFGSEEYFALLRREPELAEYFALNEEVVVVYKGRVYRVKAVRAKAEKYLPVRVRRRDFSVSFRQRIKSALHPRRVSDA